MRQTDWLFVSGAVLFFAGSALELAALTQGSGHLVAIGLVGLVGAVICLGIGSWRVYSRVDWERIEAEQRLWESGPLGRTWLRIRTVLSGRH